MPQYLFSDAGKDTEWGDLRVGEEKDGMHTHSGTADEPADRLEMARRQPKRGVHKEGVHGQLGQDFGMQGDLIAAMLAGDADCEPSKVDCRYSV